MTSSHNLNTAEEPKSDSAIDEAEATKIARLWLRELSSQHDFVLLTDETRELPIGWVFFYTTRAYLESKSPGDLVPGTAPFVVHRKDGSVKHLSSSVPPDVAIELYQQQKEP